MGDTIYYGFGQWQITQYLSQVNSYYLILRVIPEAASDVDTLNRLYARSNTGQTVPLCAFAKRSTVPVQPLSIKPSEPVPGRDDFLRSGAECGVGEGGRCHRRDYARNCNPHHVANFLSRDDTGVSVPVIQSAVSGRGRIDHGLYHPRHSCIRVTFCR